MVLRFMARKVCGRKKQGGSGPNRNPKPEPSEPFFQEPKREPEPSEPFRSYRVTNQHPNLPWNFMTHGFLDLSSFTKAKFDCHRFSQEKHHLETLSPSSSPRPPPHTQVLFSVAGTLVRQERNWKMTCGTKKGQQFEPATPTSSSKLPQALHNATSRKILGQCACCICLGTHLSSNI